MSRLLLLLTISLSFAAGAHAQTCSTEWESPVSGDWDDQTRWTNGVPLNSSGQNTGGANPCITVPGTYTVTLRPDDPQGPALVSLTVGGASGTQTLVSGGYIRTADVTIGARGRMNIIPRMVPGAFGGLDANGTVLVEGTLSKDTNSGVFLQNQGSLEVAASGTLRGTNAARLGGANGTFTIRGTAELSDGARIDARAEVLGGTVRVPSGQGDLFVTGGGVLQDATLDAAAGATLVVGGSYEVAGTLSGSPEGAVYISRATLTAAAAGATLDVTGTGLQFGLASGSQFQTVLTGGPVTNVGRLVLAPSNFFSGIRGTTLTNDGALVLEGDMSMADGAVVRNRPGGVLTMVGSQIFQNPNASVVRVVNEGLIVREDPGGVNNSRFVAVTLESLPGSEIRAFGDYLDLTAGPNEDALPPGMTLAGDGVVLFGTQPVRATLSPGTDAEPIGALGPRSFDTFVLAPEAITVLDVDAGGVSDKLVEIDAFAGATITLGGTLRVRARPGYTPVAGDEWTIGANGAANTPIGGAFSLIEVDEDLPGVTYAVDTSVPNTITLRVLTGVAGEDRPDRPSALTLEAPWPNPARGQVRLRYGLPRAGTAQVRVLDALGRQVAVLADGETAGGWHTAEWTPRVAAGVYVVQVRAGGAVQHRRLTVAR